MFLITFPSFSVCAFFKLSKTASAVIPAVVGKFYQSAQKYIIQGENNLGSKKEKPDPLLHEG